MFAIYPVISQSFISSADADKSEKPSDTYEEIRTPVLIPSVLYGTRDTGRKKGESFIGTGIRAVVPYKKNDICAWGGVSSGGSSVGVDCGIKASHQFDQGAAISAGISNLGPSVGYSSGRVFAGANIYGPVVKYTLPFIPVGPGFGEFEVGASTKWVSAGIFSSASFSPIALGVISLIDAFKNSRGDKKTCEQISSTEENFLQSENPYEKAYWHYVHDSLLLKSAGFERNWGRDTSKIPVINLITLFGGTKTHDVAEIIDGHTKDLVEDVNGAVSETGPDSGNRVREYAERENEIREPDKKRGIFAKISGAQNAVVGAITAPVKKLGVEAGPRTAEVKTKEPVQLQEAYQRRLIEDSTYLAFRAMDNVGTSTEIRQKIGDVLGDIPEPVKGSVRDVVQAPPDDLEGPMEGAVKVAVAPGEGKGKCREIRMAANNFILMSLDNEDIGDLLKTEKEAVALFRSMREQCRRDPESAAAFLIDGIDPGDPEKTYKSILCVFMFAMKTPKNAGLVATALSQMPRETREALKSYEKKISDFLRNRRPDLLRKLSVGRTKIKSVVQNEDGDGKAFKWNFNIEDFVAHTLGNKMKDLANLLEAEKESVNAFKMIKRDRKTGIPEHVNRLFSELRSSMEQGDRKSLYKNALCLFMAANTSPHAAAKVAEGFEMLNSEQRQHMLSLKDTITDFFLKRRPGILKDMGIYKKIKVEGAWLSEQGSLDNAPAQAKFTIEEYIGLAIGGGLREEAINRAIGRSKGSDTENDGVGDGLIKGLLPDNDLSPPGTASSVEKAITGIQ